MLCVSVFLLMALLAGGFQSGFLEAQKAGAELLPALYRGLCAGLAHMIVGLPLALIVCLQGDLYVWLIRWRSDRSPATDPNAHPTFKFLFFTLPKWEFLTFKCGRAFLRYLFNRRSGPADPPAELR